MSAEAHGRERISELLHHLIDATTTDADRKEAANNLAYQVKNAGISYLRTYEVLNSLTAAMDNKKKTKAREGALMAFASLAEIVGKPVEPYFIPVLPKVLELISDKEKVVRETAADAAKAFVAILCQRGIKVILPTLFTGLLEGKWQTKQNICQILSGFSETAPRQVARSLPDIIPPLSEQMWDSKKEVQAVAKKAMADVCSIIGNQDIEPFIPALISCIANPDEVPECTYKLASTTFVAQVEAPALAIMLPLLSRALAERKPAILRQASVIIDNMCKLVEDPLDVEQFLPKLLPALDRVFEVAADPELREVAKKARSTLVRVGGGDDQPQRQLTEPTTILQILKEVIAAVSTTPEDIDNFEQIDLDYITSLACQLVDTNEFELSEWTNVTRPYLAQFNTDSDISQVVEAFNERCRILAVERARAAKNFDEEVDDGLPLLCDCEFSLAYGALILLTKTRLLLKRGARYGLCGPNGSGKTTLMRAINNGQVENFPPPTELKTIFVEHSLQGFDGTDSVIEFIKNDPKIIEVGTTEQEIKEMLTSVGFDDDRQSNPVSALSGGWRMKLELSRAIMLKADILLLDEPTNHLDVKNVQWLCNYLNGLTNVTSIIVSHDSGFLDNVCTGIIHYENRKLKQYKGNLSEFVKQKPEAKAYYSLSDAAFSFKFPEPGFLDGVKSKDKAILKMSKISFTYPGGSKPSIRDATAQCALSSRVACIGPNGAGKSTMIKVLTGEVVPQVGEVWKHPNLRIAYVAQHAFHHLEQHLDKTANQYIQWRYQYGEDREMLAKESRQITEDEQKLMDKPIVIEGEKRKFEQLVGRRKGKKNFEYEVKWFQRVHDDNTWMSRDQLEALGFAKILQAFDDKEAARAGMYARPLTAQNITKHLQDVGLDPEFSTHNRVRGLSGGQKVKVVIGAAMWNQPHMLVLDEPTNYLDRDSLGALASAIKEYGGGVVIISHNAEFTKELCPEVWNVENGVCNVTGNTLNISTAEKISFKQEETVTDAF
ncbi:translational elongation factor EF-1 alpha, partial [Nowakowskiella sp. JEL0078]